MTPNSAAPERAPHGKRKWRSLLLQGVIGVFGVLVSVAWWHTLILQEDRAIEAQFQLDAGKRELVLADQLEDAMAALHSVMALYDAADEVRREQFSTFVRPLLEFHPYIQAIGWNRAVTDSARDAYEEETRAAGAPTFRITERAEQGRMVAAKRRAEYVAVHFIEPYEGNESALGFDTASEPNRLAAIEHARQTGKLAITSRITLVQERQQQVGFLGFLPALRRQADGSLSRPTNDVDGFIVGVFRLAAIVDSALAHFDPVAIDLLITDESAPPGEQRLLATAGLDEGEVSVPVLAQGTGLQRSSSIELGGRRWRVLFVPAEDYLAGLRTRAPLGGLLAGLFVTLLATSALVLVSGQRARAEEHAAELEATTRTLQQAVEGRDAAEAALVESEERLGLTLGAVADGAWDWDIATGEVFFSDSWVASLGYDRDEVEPHVSFWKSIVHPEDRPAVTEKLNRHLKGETRHYECENRLRTKSGDYRWNLDKGQVVARAGDGAPLRMVGTDTDISKRKMAEHRHLRVEQQVRQAQKLESLGVLAGGIAHDFNNLLVVILGGTDLAKHEQPPDSPAREYLELVETAAARAADLIRQIHAYSGDTSFTVERIELATMVEGVLQLLRTSVSKKARLRFDFAEDLPEIEGDTTQLRQVVMNLIVNASDALAGEPGEINVSASRIAIDSVEAKSEYAGQKLEPGDYVCVEVSDNGVGMESEVLAKIFDPFFTTKERGQGLGLAATLGIVNSHRGAVQVRSQVGQGTKVRVLLPGAGPVEIAPELTADAAGEAWRATGTALVVDDDPAVREVAKQMLLALGMEEVLTAVDGQDGVEAFGEHGKEIAVTLLDMSMPRLDGADAFRAIRRLRPDARILLSSGYTEHSSADLLTGDERAGFVQKPYRMADLREKLKSVLGA